MRHISAIGIFALLAACSTPQSTVVPSEAVLRDAGGADVGRVSLRERGDRVLVGVSVAGLAPGQHGMHLHEVGRCEGPGFQSAGGHLNPVKSMRHGHKNPQGAHLGDLGNITVGDDGRGRASVEIMGAEARIGLLKFLSLGQNGLALVVHADRDDELTDPSGNSGARIACAEIHP